MSVLDEPTLSVKQLAKLLGVSPAVVYAHANSKDPAQHWDNQRIGVQIKFTAAQVAAIYDKTRDRRAEASAPDLAHDRAAIAKALARRGGGRARAA